MMTFPGSYPDLLIDWAGPVKEIAIYYSPGRVCSWFWF
jgi:hypothetical protein